MAEKEEQYDAATFKPTAKRAAKEKNVTLPPTKGCLFRIQQDLKHVFENPVDGIVVAPDEERVNVCHALLLGPSDTPYEYGLFYFLLEFPHDYPHNPPKVTLQTTGGGTVRFSPNLYKNGKVCLSILGTWNGPSWSPVQTIESVLISIRSLMNDKPYHNEPGFEGMEQCEGDSNNYNRCIRHETLRVAVLQMAEMVVVRSSSSNMPPALQDVIQDIFLDNVEIYKYVCEEYMFLDGRQFQDPFRCNHGTFRYAELKERINEMDKALQETKALRVAKAKEEN